MSYSLRILAAAEADIDAAAEYIARDRVDAALRFYDAIDTTFRQLRQHPKRWPIYQLDHPRLKGIRKRAVAGFGNSLAFYWIDGQVVEVIRVLHAARDIPAILFHA